MQTLNPKWTLLKSFQLPLQNVQCYIHCKDILWAASTVPILIREDCSDFSRQYRCTQPRELLSSVVTKSWHLQLPSPELKHWNTKKNGQNSWIVSWFVHRLISWPLYSLHLCFIFLMGNASLFGQSIGTGKALINTDLHTLAKVSVRITGFFNTLDAVCVSVMVIISPFLFFFFNFNHSTLETG